VDGSDTQLSLNSRDERRSLEKGTSEGLESTRKLCLSSRKLVVQANDTHVLLSSTLLRLDETSGTVDTHDEATRDFGIEGTAVASLLYSKYTLVCVRTRTGMCYVPQHALDPGYDFVAGRVGGLVKINHTGADIRLQVARIGRASLRNRREVGGADKYFLNVSRRAVKSYGRAAYSRCNSSAAAASHWCRFPAQKLAA
jgi:hypothetical protein